MDKKLIGSLWVFFLYLSSYSAGSQGFTIKGKIVGLDTSTAYLECRDQKGELITLSSPIKNGEFNFKGNLPEPEMVQFYITNVWPFRTKFFLENANLQINIERGQFPKFEVKGSFTNDTYQKLEPGMRTFFDKGRINFAAHEAAKDNSNKQHLQYADSVFAIQSSDWMNEIGAEIKNEPNNYAALYFIRWLLFRPYNYDSIYALFKRLSPLVQNGIAGKDFQDAFEHAHRIAVGQPAPEIFGKDTLGRDIKLSVLKGKIVLLDFWASYCSRCRQENPQFRDVYNKYRNRGFEMLSLSLDHERNAWINAIDHDKMNWIQASELRGGASASAGVYDVTEIPRNFLIDRNGKIVDKDLRPDELNEILSHLLSK